MHNYQEKYLKTKIGKFILNNRNSLKLSQEVLSEKLGINIRTLSKIENGQSFVSAGTLCKLCNFFNLPPNAFFEIDETNNINEEKLNILIQKIRSGGNEKIDFYFNIINLIDTKYGK